MREREREIPQIKHCLFHLILFIRKQSLSLAHTQWEAVTSEYEFTNTGGRIIPWGATSKATIVPLHELWGYSDELKSHLTQSSRRDRQIYNHYTY